MNASLTEISSAIVNTFRESGLTAKVLFDDQMLGVGSKAIRLKSGPGNVAAVLELNTRKFDGGYIPSEFWELYLHDPTRIAEISKQVAKTAGAYGISVYFRNSAQAEHEDTTMHTGNVDWEEAFQGLLP